MQVEGFNKIYGSGALSGNVFYQTQQWEHLAPVPVIPLWALLNQGMKRKTEESQIFVIQ
ncbi:hypothetical protein [Okeania sp. KiyG1]|uniref:hypothetical protein n=1 Tax=Okeania sp. KiyG1 TaxID=2720165 RepID=UPI001922CFC8|nr:hypothetical protein [Okeania sp. KiyG1]